MAPLFYLLTKIKTYQYIATPTLANRSPPGPGEYLLDQENFSWPTSRFIYLPQPRHFFVDQEKISLTKRFSHGHPTPFYLLAQNPTYQYISTPTLAKRTPRGPGKYLLDHENFSWPTSRFIYLPWPRDLLLDQENISLTKRFSHGHPPSICQHTTPLINTFIHLPWPRDLLVDQENISWTQRISCGQSTSYKHASYL